MQDRELQLAQTAIQSGADAGKVAAMYKQRTGKDFPSQTQTGQSSNRTFIANKNPNEISTTSSDQPPADNIWSHGILGKLTDQLPFIGSVGGSILGGTAGTAVAPGIGTVGGAAAGGAAGAGVTGLVNTAKNYGLHNASGIEEVATKTLSAQEKVGTKLESLLANADKGGAGKTLGEVEKMITSSKPLTEGSTIAKSFGKKGFAQDTLTSGPIDYVRKVTQKAL